jgi:hypothetical protein
MPIPLVAAAAAAAAPKAMDLALDLVERLFPDPKAAEQAKLEVLRLQRQGDLAELDALLQIAQAQAKVNDTEAGSGDRYAARWRPTIGYILAAVLAYTYVLGPLLTGFAAVAWPDVTVPQLALDDQLWEITLGMLGLAGWRSWEKVSALKRAG